MSDFGVIITFKKSGESLTESDKESILTNIKSIVKNGEYSSHIKRRPFNKMETLDGEYCIKLTEYYDDEDEEDIREFAEEMDLEEADEIIEELKLVLDSSIEMESSFMDW